MTNKIKHVSEQNIIWKEKIRHFEYNIAGRHTRFVRLFAQLLLSPTGRGGESLNQLLYFLYTHTTTTVND